MKEIHKFYFIGIEWMNCDEIIKLEKYDNYSYSMFNKAFKEPDASLQWPAEVNLPLVF